MVDWKRIRAKEQQVPRARYPTYAEVQPGPPTTTSYTDWELVQDQLTGNVRVVTKQDKNDTSTRNL